MQSPSSPSQKVETSSIPSGSAHLSSNPGIQFVETTETSPPPFHSVPNIVDGTDSRSPPASSAAIQFQSEMDDAHNQESGSRPCTSSPSVQLLGVKRMADGDLDGGTEDRKRRKVDGEEVQYVGEGEQEVEDVEFLKEGEVERPLVFVEAKGESDNFRENSEGRKESEGGKENAKGKEIEGQKESEGRKNREEENRTVVGNRDKEKGAIPANHGENNTEGRDSYVVSGDAENEDEISKVEKEPALTKQTADTVAVKTGEVNAKDSVENSTKEAAGKGSESEPMISDEEEPLDLAAMSAFEYEQVAKLNPAQLRRYEQFRRSDLKNAKVKKVLVNLNPILQKASDQYVIAVKGLAKLFVGDVVETAIEVRNGLGETGALQPKHLREAYRRLKARGVIPSAKDHASLT